MQVNSTCHDCGCKGIRSCLVCKPNITSTNLVDHDVFIYCVDCRHALPMNPHQNSDDEQMCGINALSEATDDLGHAPRRCRHAGNAMEFPGVFVLPDFISEEEEQGLVAAIDESPWKPSQSGRFKQDYGPRVNFKRRKLKCSGFTGLPPFSQQLVASLASIPVLADFKPVEQCHLDYIPGRGSSIDPHIDDTWLWGERLVTVNLLSDSYLLMTPHETGSNRTFTEKQHCDKQYKRTRAVRIPLLKRALLVLYGEARYNWEHSIPREAIKARRIAVTLRELTPEFLEGGPQATVGESILEMALTFKGTVLA